MDKKNILIVTDGTETIIQTAQLMEKLLKKCEVTIKNAVDYSGTDILPADIFILGCEKPSPESFKYLEKMLLHINLAGRKCGIYSTNNQSLKYLKGMVKDCEASLADPLLLKSQIEDSDLQEWLKSIIKE